MSRARKALWILGLSAFLVSASGCVVVGRGCKTRVYVPTVFFEHCFRCFCR